MAEPAVIAGIGVAGTIFGTVAGAGISARVTTKLEKRRDGMAIARHLSNPDDWQEVMLAIQLVKNFEFAAVGLKDKQEAPPLLLATADTMIEPLDRCIDSLRKLIGDRGVPSPPPMPWPFTS